MRTPLLLAGLLALGALASTLPLGAQQGTTGTPCLNNFCVGPFFQNVTSCTPVQILGGGSSSLNIECAAPGLTALIFYSGPNPCSANALCLPATAAGAAFTACGGTSNQSIDILPSAQPPFACTSLPDPLNPGCGFCSIPVFLPPGISFSIQAVILDPVNGVPLGGGALRILTTQAYQVTT